MLKRDGCLQRQKRLLEHMERERWDLFVTGNYRTVYYFTGALSPADVPALLAIWKDGATALITSSKQTELASEIVPLETYSMDRAITLPMHDAALLLADALKRGQGRAVVRFAVEAVATSGLVDATVRRLWPQGELCDASTTILRLRKRKEEDEIDEIRQALRLCAAAYRAARDTVTQGVTEIDVYNAMQAAVTREAGTSVLLLGDFACGERGIRGGGPPTQRMIASNDLYILDLFPAPALYFGDTCRTFSVGQPTDLQHRAWEIVRQAVAIGQAAVKPGVAAKVVYKSIKEFLDSYEFTEGSFFHHAGHGIGHNGHEAPRLIPGCEDMFEVGDVFTLEPGVYTKALQGGIRLEDNYVLRKWGLENLFDFPVDL